MSKESEGVASVRHSCPDDYDVGASGARTAAPGVPQRGGGYSKAVTSACNGVIGSGGGIKGVRENGKPVVSQKVHGKSCNIYRLDYAICTEVIYCTLKSSVYQTPVKSFRI